MTQKTLIIYVFLMGTLVLSSVTAVPYTNSKPITENVERYEKTVQKIKAIKSKVQVLKEKLPNDYTLSGSFHKLKELTSKKIIQNKYLYLEEKLIPIISSILGILCVLIGLYGLIPTTILLFFAYTLIQDHVIQEGLNLLTLAIIIGVLSLGFLVGGTVLIF